MDFSMFRIMLLLGLAVLANGQTECSPQRRAADMSACLTAIKDKFVDKDLFWYGTRYFQDCPDGLAGGLTCSNSNFPNNDSLSTRMFPDGADPNLIDRYVKVNYTSAAGTYTACGSDFTEQEMKFELIPTFYTIDFPWFLRNIPSITYEAQSDEMFTIVFIDTGNNILHMVQVNIPGSNTAGGEIIRQHNGPKISYDRENAYAFFLFKQPGRLDISEEWRGKINSRDMGVFQLPEFVAAYSLTGPVGMNWVVAEGDAYAAQFMLDSGVLNNCPAIVGLELDKMSRPFLPSQSKLSVGVTVQMTSPPIEFSVCCQSYNFPRTRFMLNALDNTLYNTAEVRSENDISITFTKAGLLFQMNNLAGEMYTLITVDPDVPNRPTVGTQERPLLHMLVVNIRDGDFSTGEVVQAYGGPTPPDSSPHYYYFLIYKQQSTINGADMPSYADSSCNSGLRGRCLYDINRAVTEKNLSLVGASWMRAVNDDYVLFRQLNQSDDSAVRAACTGRKNFDIPCPTGAADKTNPVHLSVFIIALLGSFMSQFSLA